MTRRIASSNSFWENLAPLALACLAPEFSLCEPNNAFQYPNKLSIMEDFSDGPPTDINPYHVLEIETMASASEVKSAYKKLALRHHPDKVQPDARDTAHVKFQEIAFAYAILSDERRRKRYDSTGNTSDSLGLEDDNFNWSDFFREQWADAVTSDAIVGFKEKYQNSDEERRDVLASYTQARGKLNKVFGQIMLSNPLQDEDRFRGYINEAIKDGEVEAYDAYTKETKKSINQRHAKARREEHEAKEHAKKLGKYDSIFGDGDKKPNKKIKNDNDSDLAELIQQRANGRADVLLNHLEAKYAGGKNGSAKGRNGKKRKAEEPPEELFQKNRQKGEKKQKADRKEMDEEEEVDLDDDSHVSEDEEVEVNVNPVKAKKRGVTTKKGTTTKK